MEKFYSQHRTFMDQSLAQLQVGYFPTSALELSEIDSFIQSAESSLGGFDDEIQRLENLKKIRDEIVQAIHNAHALTSPVRKLPVEVLEEIFALHINNCTLTAALSFPCSLMIPEYKSNPVCPTIVLSWVCSLWRSIVEDFPSFWSSSHISIGAIIRRPERLELLRHYFVQSKNAPLDLIVDHVNGNIDADDVKVVGRLYALLFDVRSRWRKFESGPDEQERFNSWLEHHTATPVKDLCLQTNLKYFKMCSGRVPHKLLHSLSSELKNFHGDGLCEHDLDFYYPSFSNLTELAFQYMESQSIGDLVRHTPWLKKLVLGYNNPPVGESSGVVHCSDISMLYVALEAVQPSTAWEHILLPSLTKLELGTVNIPKLLVDSEGYDYFADIQAFSNVLLRSNCALQTVKLVHMKGEDAISIIALHPSIVDLSLAVYYHEYAELKKIFVEMVLQKECTSILVPNLCSLSILVDLDCCNFDSDPDFDRLICHDIAELVDSRNRISVCESRGIAQLEQFALDSRVHASTLGESVRSHLPTIEILEKDIKEFCIESAADRPAKCFFNRYSNK